MTTKARQLAELIANSLVDSDEISTGAVTTSKLADTLDFSSKTMVMADNQLSGDKIHGGTVSAFASTGIDDNASATAVTIASDGKVGIGTSSPSGFLHTEGTSNGTEAYAKFSTGPLAGDQILTVKSNSNRNNIALQANTGAGATSALSLNPDGSNVGIGTSSPDANSGLTVESSTTSGQIMVKGNNGGNAGVAFRASGQTTNFSIYENSGANLVFQKHASERMRIDSSGHLMVGTTAQEPSVSNDDSGFSVRPVGTASISRTSGPSLDLNRKTSDGDIAIFRKDGTTVGGIGTASNFMTIGSGDVGLRFHATNNVIFPHDMSANNTPNGTIDLGTTGSRFSSLWLAGTGNAAFFTANANGSAGVDTRLIAANTGNGGTNRGVAIGLNPSGSGNSVEAVKLIGYQNTAASTANNAAFAIQVANTSGTLTERLRINSGGRQSYNGTAYAVAHGNFVGEVASSGYRALSFEHTVGGGEVGSIRTSSSTAVYYGDGSQLTGVGSPSIDDNGNATAITITNDEKIGIGTTNPIGLLSIVDSSTGSGMELVPEITSNTNRLTNYNRTTSTYKNFRLDALQLEFQTSGNERMKIDNLGYVTKPNQPYFYVRAPGTQYVTAGGYVGFTWNSEVKDVGGNFASNVFTAPVTGVYSLTLNVRYDGVKDGASYYNTTIATSNRSHAQLFSPQGFDRNVDYWVFTMNVIADMDAGDTASCNVGQIGGSSGTSINGSTAFYGYLLG